MNSIDHEDMVRNWKKKWYGYWSESDNDPSTPCPLKITRPGWMGQDKKGIVNYLKRAPTVIVGQVPPQKCLICDEMLHIAAYDSDGDWLWPSDLLHYVEVHEVLLPPGMLEHFRKKGFVPPSNLENVEKLPWPD